MTATAVFGGASIYRRMEAAREETYWWRADRELFVRFEIGMHLNGGVHEKNAERTQKTGRLCSLIMRTFIVRDHTFYIRLFDALVRPRVEYCAEVWRPVAAKDCLLLQKAFNRFARRVAARCSIQPAAISCSVLPSQLFRSCDERAVTRLIRSCAAEKFFKIVCRNSRSGVCLERIHTVRSNIVNNIFSWRASRLSRGNEPIRRLPHSHYANHLL